jgi:UDP-2,3-diacylglucosamine pyrophosphatase LpxH
MKKRYQDPLVWLGREAAGHPAETPVDEGRTHRYRTIWISDLHLGMPETRVNLLHDFLRHTESEQLYLVGDIIDLWKLRNGWHWPAINNSIVRRITRKAKFGTEVIYIPGNHDEFVANYHGDFGGVTVQPKAIHTTADGRRLLVIHGHELDSVVQNIKWLAHVGDVGYQFLLKLNGPLNFIRRLFGLGYWSLSAFAKRKVKGAVNYVGKFEECIGRFAKDDAVAGVVCGHIHVPVIRELSGVTYYNCGDWVESCSALVEHGDGRMELLANLRESPRIIPLPQQLTGSLDDFEQIGRNISAKQNQAV